jgi:hypothetical protein
MIEVKSKKRVQAVKEKIRYLDKEDFKDFLFSYILVWEKNTKIVLVELKKEFVIVKRTGKCNYKKCKNACCKFCSAAYLKDYSRGFFEKDVFGKEIVKIKCNNLNKNGTCKLWGKKSSKDSQTNKGFPLACKEFPIPQDSIYWNVLDVCSYKFEVLHSIQKVGNNIREEILNCWRLQGYGIHR